MNWTRIQCLLVIAVCMVIGMGPVSPLCLTGIYCVLMRPAWLPKVMTGLYAGELPPAGNAKHSVAGTLLLRLWCLLALTGLLIVDIVPFPVTPTLAALVVLGRPAWFYRLVAGVYGV